MHTVSVCRMPCACAWRSAARVSAVSPDCEMATTKVSGSTPEPWQETRKGLLAAFDPWAFRSLGLQLFSDDLPSLRDRLPELTLPTTVLAGSLDLPFAQVGPELAGALPDAQLVLIDGAYHSPQLTHPAAWLAAMTGHLARADRSG